MAKIEKSDSGTDKVSSWLVTGDHWSVLKKLLSCAIDSVWISSPYVTCEAVDSITSVLNASGSAVKLRVVFAWPDGEICRAYLDPAALKKLMGRPNTVVEYVHPRPNNLHAKVYLIDGKTALVTSANLTGKGIGTKTDEANSEAGVVICGAEAGKLVSWFDAIKPQVLTDALLPRLLGNVIDCELILQTADMLPPSPQEETVKQAIAAALDHEVKRGALDRFKHLEGHGKQFVRIKFRGVRALRDARVLTSVADENGSLKFFHFDLTSTHHKELKDEELDGLIFVLRASPNVPWSPSADRPTVFVPRETLLGRGAITSAAFGRGKKGQISVKLSQKVDGNWILTVPCLKYREIPVNVSKGRPDKA